MGLFGNKRPKDIECDVCGVVTPAGQQPAHTSYSHIVRITPTEPSWLSGNMRASALGEYTFRCDRCNSFPSVKWPHEGGAHAGLVMHLGAAHYKGDFAGMPSPVKFDMIRLS